MVLMFLVLLIGYNGSFWVADSDTNLIYADETYDIGEWTFKTLPVYVITKADTVKIFDENTVIVIYLGDTIKMELPPIKELFKNRLILIPREEKK